LESFVLDAGSNLIPQRESPIQDESYRQQLIGLRGILCGLSDLKAPGE
ncbi:unnamed protein product, partial [Rotaria sp. Silwood1]